MIYTAPIYALNECQRYRQSEGDLARESREAKHYFSTLPIFNSLEPYGVASSRQKNKQQFDARDQDSQQ